ncbi:MAG: glycine cleavage system aminomethyltransferase GcvT [Tissierellia bacterium]|nr:glycine cleavage system aminomethyltransferase GcvT [Tissierellia bacterium]
MLKKTPLYDRHVEAGGKMVDFAGWALPVEYKGLLEEHRAVREAAGLFDVSHMGEIQISGPQALDLVDQLNTNNLAQAPVGRVVYGFFCYEDGGVVDDLLTYKFAEDAYYLVVNAANKDKVLDWIKDHSQGLEVQIEDLSQATGLLALQGPRAQKILQGLVDQDLGEMSPFAFIRNLDLEGIPVMVSRTGYTGEDGFEIYLAWEDTPRLWDRLLEAGQEEGLQPAGLGCRDTLRFEAGLPLYGHEISEDISPLEAGFKFAIDFGKPDFIGKKALEKENQEGPKRRLVGMEVLGKGIAREGYRIFKEDRDIGYVTTGYKSPTLGKALANILVEAPYSQLGSKLEVQVRKRRLPGMTISKRFLQNK